MIAPSQTDVLPRRIAASAVDLGSVFLLWALVLYRLAVRFEISNRTLEGRPIYSDFQRTQLEAIDGGINFGTTMGDFYYSLHGRGLVLSLLCLLIFSLIAWVLVPANTGWSLGHRLLNLRVTDLQGQKPPLDSYLRRYLVGLVDLFPYVIPGLLGWLIASRNEHNQRIGDLSADTVVVDVNDAAYVESNKVTTTLIRPTDSDSTDSHSAASDAADSPAAPRAADLISVDLDAALTRSGATDFPVLDLEDTSSIPVLELDPSPTKGFADAGAKSETAVISEATTPLPQKTYASEWHFPESADAPVWTPASTSDKGPTPAGASPEDEPADSEAARDAARSAGMGQPVWNEQWSAWLYWEADGKRWLRHDEAKGWVPIQDTQSVPQG